MSHQDAQIAGMAFRCRSDATLGFLSVDDGSKRVTGYNHAELVETGMITLPDLIQPDQREAVRKTIQDGINRRGAFAARFAIFTRDRTPATGILIGKGIFSGPLEMTAIEGYIIRMDTSDQEETQSGWLLPEELWQRMLGHTGDIIAYIGPDGVIRYITPSVMRILAYRADQVTGKPFTSLLITEEQTRFDEIRQRTEASVGGGTSARFIAMASGGAPIPILIRLFQTGGPDRSAILTVSPVGEEKQIAAQVNEIYRAACEASPVPLVITRRDDRRILTVNEAFLQLIGKGDPDEVTGLSLTATGIQAPPEELGMIESVLDQNRSYEGSRSGIRTPFGVTPVLLGARSFSAGGEEAVSWSMVPVPENLPESVPTIPESGAGQIRAVTQGVKTDLQLLEAILRMKGVQGRGRGEDTGRQDRTFLHAVSSLYQRRSASPDLAGIPICAYLNDIKTNVAEEYADALSQVTISVHCDGDWTVGTGTGVPVGIMVTELIANSATHAFTPGETGRIEISCTREEDWFILQVRDSGKGLPDEVTRGQPTSSGLAMVENLALQISGTATFSNEGGARVRIIFPDQETQHQ